MAEQEFILIFSKDANWARDLERELRRSEGGFIEVLNQPLELVPHLWEKPPKMLILDCKNASGELQEMLQMLSSNQRILAQDLCIARGSTTYPSEAFEDERQVLRTLGVQHLTGSGTSVPIFMREIAKARDLRLAAQKQQQERRNAVEESMFRLLLLVNDRWLTESVHKDKSHDSFELVDVQSVDEMAGEFMDETPDTVLIDPRGMNRDMKRLARLAQLFPACNFSYVVPEDAIETWKDNRPDYVGSVYKLPRTADEVAQLLEELLGLLMLARLQRQENIQRATSRDAGDGKIHTGTEAILVVDDDDEFRTVISQYLRMINYTIYQATDGLAALKMIEDKHIDLVITDIYMPRMNGFQLYFHLRNDRPHLPGILMTGYSASLEEIAPQSIEPAVLLSKPFSLNKLEPLIRGCLEDAQKSEQAAG